MGCMIWMCHTQAFQVQIYLLEQLMGWLVEPEWAGLRDKAALLGKEPGIRVGRRFPNGRPWGDAEGRGQRTEDRWQMTEDRGQRKSNKSKGLRC